MFVSSEVSVGKVPKIAACKATMAGSCGGSSSSGHKSSSSPSTSKSNRTFTYLACYYYYTRISHNSYAGRVWCVEVMEVVVSRVFVVLTTNLPLLQMLYYYYYFVRFRQILGRWKSSAPQRDSGLAERDHVLFPGEKRGRRRHRITAARNDAGGVVENVVQNKTFVFILTNLKLETDSKSSMVKILLHIYVVWSELFLSREVFIFQSYYFLFLPHFYILLSIGTILFYSSFFCSIIRFISIIYFISQCVLNTSKNNTI